MSKAVVIYKSKYGNTRFYAEWIGRQLKCDVYEISGFNKNRLAEYDTIIFGGGIYSGKINGVSIIKKNFPKIRTKRIIVFTVGLANPVLPESVYSYDEIIGNIFTQEMIAVISFFHFRGGIDYRHLGMLDEYTMYKLKKKIDEKEYENMTGAEQMFFDTYGKRIDYSDREAIRPMIEYVNSMY